jgi:phosphoesterase, MJ0936 family
MRIAVLADTHGKLPPAVLDSIREADEIWHLGDFDHPGVVDVFRGLGPVFHGVRGNCDAGIDLPERLFLERGGRSFLLIHIPPSKSGGADFLLHGHTHVPRDEKIGLTRILNPGTVGKPNKGAPPGYAWLVIDEATGAVEWNPVRL